MTIRVLSLDFDGCLFNTGYFLKMDSSRKSGVFNGISQDKLIQMLGDFVIEENQPFLERIKSTNTAKSFKKIHLFIGSNRQSITVDVGNASQSCTRDESGKITSYRPPSGSCFFAIEAIRAYLGGAVVLNRFLLADIYHQLPHGTAYQQAIADYAAKAALVKLLTAPEGTERVYYSDLALETTHPEWTFDESKLTVCSDNYFCV